MFQYGAVGYGQCARPYYFWQFLGPLIAYPGSAYDFPYYTLSPITDYGILASRVNPYLYVGSPFVSCGP